MRKRRILVTGSGGTVGSYIPSAFPEDDLYLTTRQQLDITNKRAVSRMFRDITPDVVIHLAANTHIESCELDANQAHTVNALGTSYIANASADVRAVLVYISTMAVFDGAKRFFTEEDTPKPVNMYGHTKLRGEKAVSSFVKKHFIVRAGWIIGGGHKEKKFISYILKQIQDGRKEILAVNDKFGTITYAKELAFCIRDLLRTKNYGVYHFGSHGVCSRYSLAKHTVRLLRKNIMVTPVPSSHFADTFSAQRPKHEVLRSVKLPFRRSWKESVREYILHDASYV